MNGEAVPDDRIVAVVERVSEGRHGPYAVTTCISEGPLKGKEVTFSLDPKVWQEERWPEAGIRVVLWDLVRKEKAGWRALKARFWRLSDEQAEGKEN